jgi:hypothetical protein
MNVEHGFHKDELQELVEWLEGEQPSNEILDATIDPWDRGFISGQRAAFGAVLRMIKLQHGNFRFTTHSDGTRTRNENV